MNGQMKSYNEKMAIIENFIAKVNPYEAPQPLNFDLRGYATYLKEQGLSGKHVPKSVMEKFKK